MSELELSISGVSPDPEPPTWLASGFAAAPVPADYLAPAGLAPDGGPEAAAAADPSYIWDLAASDVFPPDAVPPDEAPDEGQG